MHRSNAARSHQAKAAGASDFLQLDIAQAPPGGRADWLARQLRHAVADGRLPVGSRLPPTRVLAAELGVSRGVVTEAYRRLTEDGHAEGHRRNGTTVVAAPLPPPTRPASTPAPPPAPAPTDLFTHPPDQGVFDALRAAPARVDLTPGTPDLAAFPRAAWLRAERELLRDLPATGLGYGDPRGTPALRAAVADWLARNRGLRVTPDEVLITSGTAQTLALLGQVLTAAGVTAVAVEDPGSLGARQQLAAAGLDVPPIPVDPAGARVDALRATGAGAVLLTPAHQFPTGVVLDGARRRELLRWATEHDGLIIEDDYDSEHRYDRPPVAALRSLLADRVAYCGSASKLLAPALRIGWLVPPPEHHDALIAAKRLADLGNAALPQLVLARLMESGELERQLRLARARHRRRRDAMIDALTRHLPHATLHGPAAGLHLMATFEDPALDDTALAAAALARGVKLHPLSWHRRLPHPPGLILGYAATPPDAIREGVAALAAVVSAT
ncbi:MocR-like pyridoxine biosynthesis transcription factor PdxR [Streptomyces millisiae]|uniref:PLP-dependent aminotransferase family protein n=1 Tax=Streptomyces millisiae TaxID=3075542 RepID=A0ABU2LRB6_9ACTN|nr:PLP-dependent aminotransferase family protein [Streptomyces sp. DSM 44918]MDT0320119.1 PLP-dependent aminotransferase family protein [Streptomyces sp. DSM 44918]